MILASWVGAVLWRRGRLFKARWYLWPAQHAWWIGFVAVISGWIVTETGRQPWVAYGLLRTADAASPVAANAVATTLVLFVLVYGVVFTMGIYYINRLIARGPQDSATEPLHSAPLAPSLSELVPNGRDDRAGAGWPIRASAKPASVE
jgi:cytochrome d ubiquinol oxidase subunit I